MNTEDSRKSAHLLISQLPQKSMWDEPIRKLYIGSLSDEFVGSVWVI